MRSPVILLLRSKISAAIVTVKNTGWDCMKPFRALVLLIGITWCVMASLHAVAAQTVDELQFEQLRGLQEKQDMQVELNAQKIQELDRRQREIEAQKMNDRVTRLETIAQTEQELLIGMCLGVAGLLGEAFHSMFRNAKYQSGSTP